MMSIPFVSLSYQHEQIRSALENAFRETLDKGQFVLGQSVHSFEKEYANFSQTQFCVSVGNGLDALICALRSSSIGQGDEVIVPSHTCFATWLAVDAVGAKPVPVEVDAKTFTINPELIEAFVSPRTRAIIPVHLYGYPCAMDKIMTIGGRHNLLVVEDNAQAQGAVYKNKVTGSWGDINATSFYPTKNLGALGDGGAVTTNRKDLYEFVRSYRNYGSVSKDIFSMAGMNSRLDELQAAVLRIKLNYLEKWNAERKLIAQKYDTTLKGVGDLLLPSLGNAEAQPVSHLYVIRTNYRDRLQQFLNQQGIGSAIHYPLPIHRQEAFLKLNYRTGTLPIAESMSKSVLSIPIWPGLSEDQQTQIVHAIKQFFDHL